jgi:hypothetical protein
MAQHEMNVMWANKKAKSRGPQRIDLVSVSFHFSAPILSRLQPQPNNTPATIHAVRISKISISDHLHEHTKLDISVTNRVLGVLLFRANRLLIRANLPDVYRSGSEARPLRGHFADPHLPLRKPWPALAADWPKMARRGTRLVRSEWPKGNSNDRDWQHFGSVYRGGDQGT